MAGIWSFRLNFVKNLCLNYYSRNLVLLNFGGDKANEFPWISVWPLVKRHDIYCVGILKAQWLRPAFAESYRLLRLTLLKELVDVYVGNAPDQWHNWRVAGVRTAPPPAKRNLKTGPLPSLYFGICYAFDFSRLLYFCVFRIVFQWFRVFV